MLIGGNWVGKGAARVESGVERRLRTIRGARGQRRAWRLPAEPGVLRMNAGIGSELEHGEDFLGLGGQGAQCGSDIGVAVQA